VLSVSERKAFLSEIIRGDGIGPLHLVVGPYAYVRLSQCKVTNMVLTWPKSAAFVKMLIVKKICV
jgi:hypothetical protein